MLPGTTSRGISATFGQSVEYRFTTSKNIRSLFTADIKRKIVLLSVIPNQSNKNKNILITAITEFSF